MIGAAAKGALSAEARTLTALASLTFKPPQLMRESDPKRMLIPGECIAQEQLPTRSHSRDIMEDVNSIERPRIDVI